MVKKRIVRPLQHYLGIEWSQVSYVEQLVSALGGFLGILFILLVSYRIAAGDGRNRSGKCGLMEFTRWARYRVVLNENSWQRA